MATAKKTTAKKKPAKRAYTRKMPAPQHERGPIGPTVDAMTTAVPMQGAQTAARGWILNERPKVDVQTDKHAHYFRDISHLDKLDVYRITDLFTITDHALGHALKKIVAAGGRGAGKTSDQDVQEAIDSLVRWQEMQAENALKVG